MNREEILRKLEEHKKAEMMEINRLGKIQGAIGAYQEVLASFDAEEASEKE